LYDFRNDHIEDMNMNERVTVTLPEGDEDLLDIQAGKSVRWVPGKGWTEEE